MRVWKLVAATVMAGTVLPVYVHYRTYHVVNGYQVALAFFLWLNVIIALWEICLFLCIDLIAERHRGMQKAYHGRAFARSVDFMSSSLPLDKILSPSSWTGIWTSYAGFDDSYASRHSYGFFVDVSNGFTTLAPSLLFIWAMTFGGLPARALGLVGVLLFYQMWYGTFVYLCSFFWNRRYVGHPLAHLALIVGFLNGLWLTFPLVGIYASVRLVYSSSYAIFR
jgi:hypothetical protein